MGMRVRLASSTARSDGGRTLFGGTPARVLYLLPYAAGLLANTDEIEVVNRRTGDLARLLVDGGLASPVTSPTLRGVPALSDVTVVIPVKDRARPLARLLASLPAELGLVVVDDGSSDTRPAEVARSAGAVVLRHQECRGPAAARNTGLSAVTTPFVAFLDSDVVPRAGWLEALLVHFADPAVGLVAPRIVALDDAPPEGASARWLTAYEKARSSLDLGPTPALVVPRGPVSYVPSAALVARVAAIPGGFDEDLSVAEDVDLVWRTLAAGWRVRYEPAGQVAHEHRVDAGEWLSRKAFYGTGAALLAQRHPGALAPAVMAPWTAVAVVALLCQRRWSLPVAAASSGVAVWRISRRLGRSEHPVRGAARLVPYGLVSAGWQTAGLLNRHWWPAALVGAVVSRRVRRAVVAAALVEGVADWRRVRAEQSLLPYVAAHRLDDLAYGVGLWAGAAKERTLAPLLPDLGFARLSSWAGGPRQSR
ncbi:MAG: mycofactocin glycosyltransferase [Actinomycetota bacterium]|jgi:mycofactocin system glycosyltransferase|nr:mycofactocin glycosyltransferase [Actinomycetota bacterium]